MELLDDKLRELAQKGWIAGPDETAEEFAYRYLKGRDHPSINNTFFGFTIDWVPLEFKNKKLAFWEGGATWISSRTAEIQLRACFEKRHRFLGYTKDEIIQHESVHAVRSAFEESAYEEILAYMTSPKKWRRLLGPLFRSEKACGVWLAAMVFFPLGGVLILAFHAYRLWLDMRKYKITLKKLERITNRPRFFSLFLTDNEIRQFSGFTREEILDYAEEKTCCRWNQLRMLFL